MSGSDKSKVLQLTRYAAEFASDWESAIRSARAANDRDGQEGLINLWFEFFEGKLPRLDERQLIQYLENCRVWRKFNAWPIYKTADAPCLAFTASIYGERQKVILVALGCCYRYSDDDEEKWWRDVILPRVRRL